MRKFIYNLSLTRRVKLAHDLMGNDCATTIDAIIEYCKAYRLSVTDLIWRYPDLKKEEND